MGQAPIPVEFEFTEEQKKQIVDLYKSGKTQKEIGIAFGKPKRTIMKLLSRLGIECRKPNEAQKSKFDKQFVEDVVRLRSEGHTIEEIAKQANRSISAVHRVCQKMHDKIVLIDGIDTERICEEYVTGKAMSDLAFEHKTSIYFIRKALVDKGITIRPPIMGGGSKIKITNIDLPPFEDSFEWWQKAYVKYGLSSIAKFLGRSVGYAASKVKSYGIELKTISERNIVLDRQAVLSSYKELGSMSKVAQRYNCTITSIRNILEGHGVTPLTASEILSGPGNPFYGKQHTDETRALCAEMGSIAGTKFWKDHPEYVEVVRQKQKELWNDVQKRYEDSKLISKLRSEGKCGPRRGNIQSRFGEMAFDSSYEMRFIECCEQDNRIIYLERDFDVIPYEYDGLRHFIPDFRLWFINGDFLIVEVKAYWYAMKPKEHLKISAGFAKYADKFIVVKKDFSEIMDRIEQIFSPQDFEFKDLALKEIESDAYVNFYDAFHYKGSGGRRGITFGAFLKDRLIAAATISSVTRAEIAEKQGLSQSDMRELVRFCIHPEFHKRNFATWLLSRVVDRYKQLNPHIRMLVSFADTTQGHIGTIYKAANWNYDGVTAPSYHYEDKNGGVIHKKTVYDRAGKEGMSERDYAIRTELRKVPELAKMRFLMRLS